MRTRLIVPPEYSVIRKAACSYELEIKKERIDVMSKTTNVTTMQEKLARLNERSKSAEAELRRLEEKRKKIQEYDF